MTLDSKQKVLILGGSNFIGRNLVESLLKLDEYELTLFNRQVTNSQLFPETTKIKGDRQTEDIKQISKTDWDYVIDLSCYFPQDLRSSLKALKINPKRYLFVSTCSVYDNEVNQEIERDEYAPILSCDARQEKDHSDATYGRRKAECERILQDFGIKHVIFRPALVVGKYDNTDRFYYWPHQVKTYEDLLVPDKGERTFSITFVADLVHWITNSMVDYKANKIYNAVSVPRTSIQAIIKACQTELNRHNVQHSMAPDQLKAFDIGEWTDLPLWLNCDYYTYSNQQIIKDLSEPSSFTDIVKNTLEYYKSVHWPKPKTGISESKRQEVLASI